MHDNHVKSLIHQQISMIPTARIGIVTSVDPVNGLVVAGILPDFYFATSDSPPLTGWIPQVNISTGTATIVAPLEQGEQCLLLPDSSDSDNYVAIGGIFSLPKPPPISPATGKQAQAGEVLITCGPLYWHMAQGKIHTGGGDLVHNGNITATGNVTAGVGSGDVVELLHHAHMASGGTGNGGPPVAGS